MYFDYENKRLESLSARMMISFADQNSYLRYRDMNIVAEDLKYNLALLIAAIIQQMQIPLPTEGLIKRVISDYNFKNKAIISYDDYQDRAWIRIINEEVRIPTVVRYRLRELFDKDKNEGVEKESTEWHMLACLHQFLKSWGRQKPTITASKLDELIHQYAHGPITRSWMIENKLLRSAGDDIIQWQSNDYCRHLRNEIAAALWLLCLPDEHKQKLENFRKYIRRLEWFDIYPERLDNYLPPWVLKKMDTLIVEMIKEEDDLKSSKLESSKIHFDSPSYRHITWNSPIPSIDFTATDSFKLVNKIKTLDRWHDTISDYQETRSIYGLLIRLLLRIPTVEGETYAEFRQLLNDVSRPYIVVTGYDELKRHAYVIPFLLLDNALAPLVFLLLDELEADKKLLREHSFGEKIVREEQTLKIEYWQEAYQYVLDKIRFFRDYNTGAKNILQILSILADEVFSFNSNNYSASLARHELLLDCYQQAWNDLGLYRVEATTITPSIERRPSLASLIWLSMAGELSRPGLSHQPNEFIRLDLSYMDLQLELIKLADKLMLQNEIKEDQKEDISERTKELVIALYENLINFFLVDNVTIINYLGEIENRKAKRGIGNFGLEILDWTYLFLYLIKLGLASNLDQQFKDSLIFDNDSNKGRYSEQNLIQVDKLRVYLRILLIAHRGLSATAHNYKYSYFNANDTISFLEDAIAYYSYTYNTDDLSVARIDIFDETIYGFNNDPYKQQLSSLLYESVNQFSYQNKIKFVSDFFENSNDIARMLTAINRLDTKAVRDVIVTRMDTVNLEQFIMDARTVTHLENALLEATNSNDHFDKAGALLNRIEQHITKRNIQDYETKEFLFKIKLLLAFKKEDISALRAIEVPQTQYNSSTKDEVLKNQRRKEYYEALHTLYHLKEYENAIQLLEPLLTQEPNNIDFAFHLYRARVYKAYQS